MAKLFSTVSGFKPSWGSRFQGVGAALQGRDFRDPELEAYLEEQRLKKSSEYQSKGDKELEELRQKGRKELLTTVPTGEIALEGVRQGGRKELQQGGFEHDIRMQGLDQAGRERIQQLTREANEILQKGAQAHDVNMAGIGQRNVLERMDVENKYGIAGEERGEQRSIRSEDRAEQRTIRGEERPIDRIKQALIRTELDTYPLTPNIKPQLGVKLTSLTPEARDRFYRRDAERAAASKLAQAQIAPTLSSINQAKEQQAIAPRVGEVARAGQEFELSSAQAGTQQQKNAADFARGKAPFMSSLGTTEAEAAIAKNAATQAADRVAKLTSMSEEAADLPMFSTLNLVEKAKAGAQSGVEQQRKSTENLRIGVPEAESRKELLNSQMNAISKKFDIEEFETNRDTQKQWIQKTLENKLTSEQNRSILLGLQAKAMQGDLSQEEKDQLRSIVLGIFRPTTEDKLLNAKGAEGLPIRTPEEQALLDELAAAVNKSRVK